MLFHETTIGNAKKPKKPQNQNKNPNLKNPKTNSKNSLLARKKE